jgi:hypothetical protein
MIMGLFILGFLVYDVLTSFDRQRKKKFQVLKHEGHNTCPGTPHSGAWCQGVLKGKKTLSSFLSL